MKLAKDKKYLKLFLNGVVVGLAIILVVWVFLGFFGLLSSKLWENLDLRGDILIFCILILIAIVFGLAMVVGEIILNKSSKDVAEQELNKKVEEQLNDNV